MASITRNGTSETDRYLPDHYNAELLDGKRACKKALLEEFGMPADQ